MKKLYSLVATYFLFWPCNAAEWTKTLSHFCQPPAGAQLYGYKKMTPHHPFSQLIFSWNGIRPKQGFFRFYARTFDPSTSSWDSWHVMGEWGAGVQKSYFSRGERGTAAHYVRLEVPAGRLATGFAIKVEAHGGASLQLLKMTSVNLSHLAHFELEKASDFDHLSCSVQIDDVPKISQMALDHPESKSLCSPTSCAMLIGFITNKVVDPCKIAEGVFDQGLAIYGSWPFNIAHAFEHCDGTAFFRVERLASFQKLYDLLWRKRPLAVSVRGDLPGAIKSFPKGHILVVVGFDAKTKRVMCHDPAWKKHEDVCVSYALKDFLAAWARSHYLAYTLEFATHKNFLLKELV